MQDYFFLLFPTRQSTHSRGYIIICIVYTYNVAHVFLNTLARRNIRKYLLPGPQRKLPHVQRCLDEGVRRIRGIPATPGRGFTGLRARQTVRESD